MSKAALIHLAEECGELTQAAIKAARFGKNRTTRKNLTDEAGDVLALIEVLEKLGVIDGQELRKRFAAKDKHYTERYIKEKK